MTDFDKDRIKTLTAELEDLNRRLDTYNENLISAFNLINAVLTRLHTKKDSETRRYADLDRENIRLITENTRLRNILRTNAIDTETPAPKETK